MTRADRRRLRRQLQAIPCGVCDGPLDERCHRSVWIPEHGEPVEHLTCQSCYELALADPQARIEMGRTVALRFAPPGGTA
jgi:hypothetical protein